MGLAVLESFSPDAIEKEWRDYVDGTIINELKAINEKLVKMNILLEELVKAIDGTNFRLEQLIKVYCKVNGL